MHQCPTCKAVNFICFWGDMPQKKWKRPILLILCLVGLIGGSFLFYVSEHPSAKEPFTILLALALAALLALGLLASFIGCDRCVARLFGKL